MRSDGVLNPSGVRFGSGEIYTVLERFTSVIDDSLCVGQRRAQDKDERVLLFLKMRAGHRLDDPLVGQIKDAIRTALSARHVPAFVLPVEDIPVRVSIILRPAHCADKWRVLTVLVYGQRQAHRDCCEANRVRKRPDAKRDRRKSGVPQALLQVSRFGSRHTQQGAGKVEVVKCLCCASLALTGFLLNTDLKD